MYAFKWLIQQLASSGVNSLFGVPGYANSLLFIEAEQSNLVTPILSRHESSAGWLAIGYAEGGRPFGAFTVTSGAGVTNAVSAVVAAYYNSVPLLILSGQVETSKFGRGGFQELTGKGPRGVDACEIFSSMTKYNKLISNVEDLPRCFFEAMHAMKSGRPGPVHLNIPIDVLKKAIPPEALISEPIYNSKIENAEVVFDRIQAELNQSKNPLLLIGKGCQAYQNELRIFVHDLKIPVATTIHAKSFIENNSELHLGIIGISGSPRCNDYVEKCDLILCLGSSLSEFTTSGFNPSFFNKKMVRIDIDNKEFEAFENHLNICMNLENFFKNRYELTFNSRIPKIHSLPKFAPVTKFENENTRIAPFEIIDLIAQYAPDDTYFTADSGNNAVWTIHYLETKRNQSFFVDVNTGCMGSGIMSAIGIKFANEKRPVVAICGDGGFLMNGVEIGTAVEHNLGILWIVMNDQKLGMVVQGDRTKYGASAGAEFGQTNIYKMAESLGATSLKIETAMQLEAFLKSHDWQSPVVLDVLFNDLYLPSVYSRTKQTSEDTLIQAN